MFSKFDDVVLQGYRYRVCAIYGSELTGRRLGMLVNGSLGDAENFADLSGRFAPGNPNQHFPFPAGQ